jgi:hypothetical protein
MSIVKEKPVFIPEHWWTVKLLKEDVAWCEKKGKDRNSYSNSHGWKTKATTTGAGDHIIGIAGELAVSLVTGRKIQFTLSKSKADCAKSDLEGGIDVKTRKEKDPERWDLAINNDQLKDDRVYILALAFDYPAQIHVVGWEWGDVIRKHGERRRHGTNKHLFYLYPYGKLQKISELFNLFPPPPMPSFDSIKLTWSN